MLLGSAVHYTAAAVSDRGRKRPTNEDAFGFSVEHGVYLVCDGMGGAAAGEIASSLAVDEALRVLTDRDPGVPLEAAVKEAVRAANDAIYSRSQREPQLSGMGTTLVGLAADASRVLVFNVGDSRCYRLRNSGSPPASSEPVGMPEERDLQQITLDHSLVEEQVRMGRMSHAEAQRSPLRNVITRALGTQSSVTPDLFELAAEPGDLFLLCSDGLTGELSDEVLRSILAAGGPLDDLCARLIKAANKAGGHDNLTCLLVRAEESPFLH
ncbi:MAG: PP2C family protein-serine/threonine phosphatase [Terracidiphilus sp.]